MLNTNHYSPLAPEFESLRLFASSRVFCRSTLYIKEEEEEEQQWWKWNFEKYLLIKDIKLSKYELRSGEIKLKNF